MTIVLANNEPAYIEDFRSQLPDWANGNHSNGDPDPETDWLPAFKRAAYDHLIPESGNGIRMRFEDPFFAQWIRLFAAEPVASFGPITQTS
jgi:hypothetical protein